MADIKSTDRVLQIGCGMIPSESILIARETGANIIGIDNNNNAVKLAKKVVAKRNLSHLIKLEYGDGTEYPVDNFDVITIAINVWPLDHVLRHLSEHAKKDVRIIYRGMKDDVVQSLSKEGLTDQLHIKSSTQNPKTQSILLVKES